MTPEEIARALNGRADALGMEASTIAAESGMPVRDVREVLSGARQCRLAAMMKVADVLGFVAVVVPRPLAPVVEVGHKVTEPRVVTRVQQALSSLQRGRVVLFLDVDGVAHAVGDSRVDDRGALVGDRLFRWWPVLEGILGEHPEVDVVVHSSWRLFWPTLDSLAALLPESLAARVIAITDPEILGRHQSIQSYLEHHPEVISHVIVDDEERAFPPGLPELVLCDAEGGLGDPDAQRRLREALTTACARTRPRGEPF